MKRKRYLEEKITPILQEHEAGAGFNQSEPVD
jgi:hypothetical protein